MASKTKIANRALSKLGEKRVSNIDTDDVKSAKVIREMWDLERDALLAAYPWNFAIKYTQLAVDTATPSWRWDNQYTLPADFLTLVEIKDNPDYELAGNKILTNEDAPLYIRYVSRITNTGEFDALFTQALAAHLAVEACEELAQSNTKKQILIAERREIISTAYASDAIQNPHVERAESVWLEDREASYVDDEINYNA